MPERTVRVRGTGMTIADVVAVARRRVSVAPLDSSARSAMESSREWVEEVIADGGRVVYGLNTGYGSLAGQRIEPSETDLLSRNVILKCAVGCGPPLAADWVRAMMLIRANSLAIGHSGIRPEIVDALIDMLNRGVTPWVPSKGSLGASGDLAPLAHIACVLTRGPDGMPDDYAGRAWVDGELMDGDAAMERAGILRHPVVAKEGLALTNGTTMMAAGLALGLHDARVTYDHALLAAALSFEALRALPQALDPALHEANGQPGQVAAAARLRALLEGSRLIGSDPDKVQDAYSLRCTAQVLGPIEDMLAFLEQRTEAVLNAASDNPLIFEEATGRGGERMRAVSGGNFHGAGPALWLDTLAIAVAEIANLSDRRVFRLLTPELSGGLPAMLVPRPGLNGGLMTAQYTAAALVSDNKTLAHPDSVDSVPSSANQEDHVSMGANAARHAREVLDNVRTVVAIELMSAAQGVDLRPGGADRLAPATRAVHAGIRGVVDFVERDRALVHDVEAIESLIEEGTLLAAAEAALAG